MGNKNRPCPRPKNCCVQPGQLVIQPVLQSIDKSSNLSSPTLFQYPPHSGPYLSRMISSSRLPPHCSFIPTGIPIIVILRLIFSPFLFRTKERYYFIFVALWETLEDCPAQVSELIWISRMISDNSIDATYSHSQSNSVQNKSRLRSHASL